MPLNELGQRQAATLAGALKDIPVDAVYCSDLLRAVQTAEAILSKLGLPLLKDVRLRERNMGALQVVPASLTPFRCLLFFKAALPCMPAVLPW